jgi:hypothetical protein
MDMDRHELLHQYASPVCDGMNPTLKHPIHSLS